MTQKPLNTPLADLSEEELIDLIIVLGAFSNLCRSKQRKEDKLPLETLLSYCLKWYDMNLLHISCKGVGQYHVETSKIPVSIIKHLVEQDDEFLPENVTKLVVEYIKLVDEEQIFERKRKKK